MFEHEFTRAVFVKQRDISNSSPQNDGVGVQNIDHGCNRLCKLLPQALEGLNGKGLPLLGAAGDFRKPNGLPALFSVESFQRGTGNGTLNATGTTAIAGVGFSKKRIVPPLTSNSMQASQDTPVDNDSAADACAKNNAKNNSGPSG